MTGRRPSATRTTTSRKVRPPSPTEQGPGRGTARLTAPESGRAGFQATVKGFDLTLVTTPGLFAPRGPDAGTLAMLEPVTFAAEDKVLDLGCGYGLVGVVAAKFMAARNVVLLDNDAQAIEMARLNLAANGAPEARVILSDGFADLNETGFTKILSHPPYHSDFAVAKHFIEKAFNRLAIGGSMWMVTKRDQWYRNKLTAIFGGVRVREIGGYFVFQAEKRSSQYGQATRRPTRP